MAGRAARPQLVDAIQAQAGADALAHEKARQQHEQAQRERRSAEVSKFMARNGLRTTEDCIAYCRRMAKRISTRPPSFEHWAEAMTQRTVDLLVISNGPDDRRVLSRLRDLGVVDEQDRLVPREGRREAIQRAAAARRAERERLDAELQARCVSERKPG